MTTPDLELDKTDYRILHILTHGTAVQSLCIYLQSLLQEASLPEQQLSPSTLLKQVQRRLYALKDAGLVTVINPGEKPQLWLSTPGALDLFSSTQNSNSVQKSPFDIPNRCGWERKKGIEAVCDVSVLDKETKEIILDHFTDYLNDKDAKIIILKALYPQFFSSRGKVMSHDFLFLPYKHRFNDPKKHKKNLFIYNNVWDTATRRYKRAVHLVLTTDPKRFKNLWEANRHFSIAFNRFMSYLTKHFGSRPKYLSSFEYTKKGLMHCHIIIFGAPYLLPHEIITREWERCDQGSYNYIYSLINNDGDWIYARKKPKELKEGETARDYLQKYLKKGSEQPATVYLYWLFNKRFFTYSKALFTDPWEISTHGALYRFLMTCYEWDLPDITLDEPHFFVGKPPPWEATF